MASPIFGEVPLEENGLCMVCNQLPCDTDGICMICNSQPIEEETLTCKICTSPWHVCCLVRLPDDVDGWMCPDCLCPDINFAINAGPARVGFNSNGLLTVVRAIEADSMLSATEKARRRQQLMSCGVNIGERQDGLVLLNCSLWPISIVDGIWMPTPQTPVSDEGGNGLNCAVCKRIMFVPITTPCRHSFCHVCVDSIFYGLQRFNGEGTSSRGRRMNSLLTNCPLCFCDITGFLQNPRVNTELQMYIRAFQPDDDVNDVEVGMLLEELKEDVVVGFKDESVGGNVADHQVVKDGNLDAQASKRARHGKAVVEDE